MPVPSVPAGGSSSSSGFSFNPSQFGAGLGTFLGGLFGDSGAPYDAAMGQYQDWMNRAQNVQNPYLNAGNQAIPAFQNWLNTMKDPSGFINNLMGGYQQSPYAKYLQQQAMRAGTNAASASGLVGSTPFAEQMQTNAANIASGDMQDWLKNVLGINTQYGAGEQNLIGVGQNAANSLTSMYGDVGKAMAEAAYGQKAGQNNDFWNTIGGAAGTIASFL